MIVKSISLTNFRNHENYRLDCEAGTSLILGANGWGKTSILEAVYILTRGKSFRASDPEILRHGAPAYFIKLEYENGEVVTAGYDGKTKIFNVENKKVKRLPANKKYPVVLFLPSDLNLIDHAPSRRRDYFDAIFGTLDETYAGALNKYNKALKQRAELLKTETVSRSDLFPWDILLARFGAYLSNSRADYVQKINGLLNNTYHSIAENSDHIDLSYKTITDSQKNPFQTVNSSSQKTSSSPSILASNSNSSCVISEQQYLNKLEQSFEKDHYLGYTTFGIHHDDYIFNFNTHPASVSASRGETRSIVLSLKFIEAELYKSTLGKQPLILLDDVFSELDSSRRRSLVQNFQNHQVLLTSVENLDPSN